MSLADVHDNYVSQYGNADDAALYVKDSVEVIGSSYTLDLNGNALYYGDSRTGDMVIEDGRVAQMIKTTYGDFNGDCVINSADSTIFYNAFVSGVSPGASCFPLADANGDCDVDIADEAVFLDNYDPLDTDRCWCSGSPCSDDGISLSCPTPLPTGACIPEP